MSNVRINNLSVSYISKNREVEALHNLSLEISDGDIYSIIGPSGCGKSTLLHVLGGIIKEYSGEIRINGQIPDPKKQSIGLIPQNYGLLPWKKIKDNILLAAKIKHTRQDRTYNEEIIAALELQDTLYCYPHELSGGQRQRVALARSFIQKPDLLLMDEPFSALDALTAEKCRDLFLDVWKKHKVTTLFITHNIEEAVRMGKYIVLLSKAPGHVVRIIENPLMKSGADRSADAYFSQAKLIRELIIKEWV